MSMVWPSRLDRKSGSAGMDNKILAEEDKARQAGWIRLITLTRDVLLAGIDVLGFEAPERM